MIFSGGMIGFLVANSFRCRPKALRDMQVALSMLETEIGYGQTPLAEAFESIGKKVDPTVSKLFLETKSLMTSKGCCSPGEAWQRALDSYFFGSHLTNYDMEVLTSLGKYLGFTDRQDQIKHIKLALANLKHQETIALDEKEKNEKLWKYLGVLSGIMVFLLLY